MKPGVLVQPQPAEEFADFIWAYFEELRQLVQMPPDDLASQRRARGREQIAEPLALLGGELPVPHAKLLRIGQRLELVEHEVDLRRLCALHLHGDAEEVDLEKGELIRAFHNPSVPWLDEARKEKA